MFRTVARLVVSFEEAGLCARALTAQADEIEEIVAADDCVVPPGVLELRGTYRVLADTLLSTDLQGADFRGEDARLAFHAIYKGMFKLDPTAREQFFANCTNIESYEY